MGFQWQELFGAAPFVALNNRERPYFGLDPVQEDWDATRFVSKTNSCYTRTTVYWCGDEIRKVVCEENGLPEGAEAPSFQSVTEYDTCLKTENRQRLLPLTGRGKPKPVTPSAIGAATPLGCSFFFCAENLHHPAPRVRLLAYNARNHLELAVGEEDRLAEVRNDADFHRFMDYYIESCPADYMERVHRLRTQPHQTVKYRAGDVFRIELDRFTYAYGLITGRVREMEKWPELPKTHSLRGLMMVPILVRYYDLVTENPALTPEELAAFPLGRVDVCGDNDIIWGTHRLVGHRALRSEDIEFRLVCKKIGAMNAHSTLHTYELLSTLGMIPRDGAYNLYVEWGTASTVLPYAQISEALKEALRPYRDPNASVKPGIFPDFAGSHYISKNNLLDPAWAGARQELFRCLGLAPDADFDAFAAVFGGLSKQQLLQKLQPEGKEKRL